MGWRETIIVAYGQILNQRRKSTLVSDLVDKPNISVCMAAYNGEQFIVQQIESIVAEIGATDELIIVDDCSTDNTVEIIKNFVDPRIKLFSSPQNQGYVKTFVQALNYSVGEYIFLSDQDDIWVPGRVKVMLEALQTKMLVVGNCEHFGAETSFFHRFQLKQAHNTKSFWNIWGIFVGYRLYWGCAMGFRKELLDLILPVPEVLFESHDQYFAMAANLQHSVAHLEAKVVRHRLHNSNQTPKKIRSLQKIFQARINYVKMFFMLRKRNKNLSI